MFRITKKLSLILSGKQKRQVWGLVVLMLIGGVMESLSVSTMFPLIDAVMNEDKYAEAFYAKLICKVFGIDNQMSYVKTLLVLLIILFLLKNAFLLFQYYIQNAFIAEGKFQMQRKLMHTYMEKPYIFFLNTSTGDLLQIVVRDTSRAFNMLQNVLIFYTELIVAGILAITILIISPQISILTGAALVVEVVVIAKIIKPIMGRIGLANRAEEASANKWFLQSINGVKSIKVEDRTAFFEGKYCKHTRNISNYEKVSQTLGSSSKMIIEGFTVATVLAYMLIMIGNGMSLVKLLPQLSAFLLAAMRLLPSMNRISNVMNQAPFIEVGLDNVIKVLNDENLDVNDFENVSLIELEEDKQELPVVKFDEVVELKNISFRYPSGEKQILDNASVTIKKGESIGVVGPSGAGKTTAIDIMLGLLKPQTGKILVDGLDIEENISGWLSHLSYIPQQIFLMDDTIRANVAFGEHRTDIDDEKVWAALKDAQMDEFVKSLPEGLNTEVGEAGVRLSGGQRQRIGIARALYSNPDILFFDEATSALDNETEAAIMESIDHLKGSKTLIIIAHRLTTIENCDTVLKVENGKITKER